MESKIVDVRRLGGHHFEALLRSEVQAWTENLHWDYDSSAKLILSYLEQKRLLGFALVENGLVKGYCLYFREGPKASIGDVFVEVNGQAARVDRLLGRAVDDLLGAPGLRRIEAQLPHCDVKSIEPLLRTRSFQVYLRQFMALALDSYPAYSARDNSESGDFTLVPWTRRYDRDAAHLLHGVYRNHIDSALNDQYRTVGGASRLVESIVRYRGCGDYLEHASTAAIHRATGRLAAILAVTSVRFCTAHIPQIAVASNYQGSGLGTAMLHRAFRQLLQDGFSEISLTVTSLNSRAVRLYERLGFQTFRTFGAFVWER